MHASGTMGGTLARMRVLGSCYSHFLPTSTRGLQVSQHAGISAHVGGAAPAQRAAVPRLSARLELLTKALVLGLQRAVEGHGLLGNKTWIRCMESMALQHWSTKDDAAKTLLCTKMY